MTTSTVVSTVVSDGQRSARRSARPNDVRRRESDAERGTVLGLLFLGWGLPASLVVSWAPLLGQTSDVVK